MVFCAIDFLCYNTIFQKNIIKCILIYNKVYLKSFFCVGFCFIYFFKAVFIDYTNARAIASILMKTLATGVSKTLFLCNRNKILFLLLLVLLKLFYTYENLRIFIFSANFYVDGDVQTFFVFPYYCWEGTKMSYPPSYQ